MEKPINVSILILAYNEQINIQRCLESVQWSDDVLVIDSGSIDATVEIAEKMNARVLTREFDNFADQRNFGIDHGDFKHDWIFHLDADECIRPELAEELVTVASENPSFAYRVAGRIFFRDTWIRRSSMYPCYQVRFGRSDHLRFKMVGHGQRETTSPGEIKTLKHDLDHYSFSKGIADWIARHNRYSTDEANQILSEANSKIKVSNLFNSNSTERRRELKRLYGKLPCRPLLRMLYILGWRLGFLDGVAGYQYAKLLAMYEQMISFKLSESKEERN